MESGVVVAAPTDDETIKARSSSSSSTTTSRLTYAEMFQLLHSEEPNSTEKLIAEYEAVRLEAKQNQNGGGRSSPILFHNEV
jgi:hypothetical protein